MTAGRSDRRPVKIRRTGRHTTPSQVEKVAQQAGKAAPAFAIAGALVAAPQAQHALTASAKPATAAAQSQHASTTSSEPGSGTRTTTAALDSVDTRTVTVASATTARHAATATSTAYQVRSGDTLSKIADRFYHNADDWQYLYHENAKTVSDPNLIYVGQNLVIPATVPANYTPANYVPKHAKPAETSTAATATATNRSATASTASSNSENGGGSASSSSSSDSGSSASGSSTAGSTGGTAAMQSAPQGVYSCSGLEQLWEQAGGNPADAFMAAEIAMAESGGNPDAISPTSDYGLWQINSSNGSLATLNPLENARSAVALSSNGTNWGPWTTYHIGAYSGKC